MISTKSLIGLLLLCGVFAAPSGFAKGPIHVSLKYSGAGYDVSEKDADNMAINILLNDGKGTFGPVNMAILSEFAVDTDASVSCPAEYPLAYDLVRAMTTMTAANLDMLYGTFIKGWLCMSADLYEWIGGVEGVWFDGTGKFKGATGVWSGQYLGNNLDEDSGFRTITGNISGTLELK